CPETDVERQRGHGRELRVRWLDLQGLTDAGHESVHVALQAVLGLLQRPGDARPDPAPGGAVADGPRVAARGRVRVRAQAQPLEVADDRNGEVFGAHSGSGKGCPSRGPARRGEVVRRWGDGRGGCPAKGPGGGSGARTRPQNGEAPPVRAGLRGQLWTVAHFYHRSALLSR